MRKKEQDEIVDSFVAGDKPLLLPEGRYIVQCFECKEVYYKAYNAVKLRLEFRIIEGVHEGKVLLKYYNLTDNRTGEKYKSFSPHTDYYSDWVIANNGNLPSRKDRMRMPYRIFKNGIFEVKVRNTKRKYRDGSAMPECLNYSVADHLIKRLA